MKNKKSLYLEKDGLKLHYRIMGEGKPIILLNPAFADLRVWNKVEESLSKKYKVIQFDFRYTGKTEQDNSDYSMFEDLNYLIDELGLINVNLIGLSAGGHTALEFAIQYPKKVDKLFIISTGLIGVNEDNKKVVRMKEFQSALYSGSIEEAARIWTKTWLIGENRSDKDISSDKYDLFMNITKQNILNGANYKMPNFIDPPINVQLDKLDKEVYHLIGSLDYEDVFNSSKVFYDKINNYKEELVNSAHIIPLELPELLVDKIVEFIY
jgi:pimeloyl-ACP methyl ester carboxylesterase